MSDDSHAFSHAMTNRMAGWKPDKNIRADKKTLDTVWDIVQGRTKPVDEAPIPAGHITVEVPDHYVHAIAFYCAKALKRVGATKGFGVKTKEQEPVVTLDWQRPGGLTTRSGNGYAQDTDCLAAWVAKLDPQHVAKCAVEVFLENISTKESMGG